MTADTLPTIRHRDGRTIDLEAFAQRWMSSTMTPADDALWGELVEVESIRRLVLARVGY